MKKIFVLSLCLVLVVGLVVPAYGQKDRMELKFFYPVGVAGPLAKVISDMTNDFNKAHPEIYVEPIFAGGYHETFTKVMISALGKEPPDVAVLTAADVWASIDVGIIIPLDDFVEKAGGEEFLDKFQSAFVKDCVIGDYIWAIPFQKSTPIFYYNKDAFREVGLDPERPPQTWWEMLDYAKKLIVVKDGDVERWGLEIPVDQWLVSAFIMQNGGRVNNPEGTETYLDSLEAIEALQFMVDLAQTHKIMPPKKFFGDASADFVAGKTAMMYNSTGGLTFVRGSATFDWDVCFLPAGKYRATPTGGGQFVIFEGIPETHKEAAWKFINWMISPESAARWSMASGYVAVRKDAFETPTMIEYVKEVPQALVALEQLKFALREPPATHDARKIAQIITIAVEEALAGEITAEEAFTRAQREAEEALKPFLSR